jgi:WD40 repeat protein
MSAPRSSVLELIDQICDRYEVARLAGQRPRIDDYLRGVPEAERSGLLRELLRVERDYLQSDQRRRWQRGERVLVRAYLEEAPSLRDYPDLVFELVCGEVLLRGEVGERPRPADYLDLVPTHQSQLRRLFVARGFLPPETLQGVSDRTMPQAAQQATAVAPDHTVDELPPPANEPAPAKPPPRREVVPAPPGYEVLGKLGRGGMGVVYKARQVNAARLVALKMLRDDGDAGPAELARFRTEAEAIARLQDPHVVQVFEVGEHQGLPFFSLELCPGGSLDRKLAGTPLPPQQAAALVAKVAEGVQAAHAARVLHRDLKPGNVLLAADGTPKVTDFGLAKKLDTQGVTLPGVIMGTPSYMAPEQASGQGAELGPAADVYALGALLYECLTGRPPFRAATVLDTLRQVVSEEPVPPRQLNAQVPRDLETVCLKCLSKEPGRRYASAEALADELERYLAGRPIVGRPVGRVERAAKWARRRPATAGLLTLVVLVTVAGIVSLLWQYGQTVEERDRADREADDARQMASKEKAARGRAEFQALRADHARHAILMKQALSAWERHDVAEAERALGEVAEPFQQTWETRHLRGLCGRKAMPLLGHAGGVMSVAFSPDGRRIASAAGDGAVRVWDARTGQEKLTLMGHASSVAYSPDGRRIASGGFDVVRLWDAATGQEVLSLKLGGWSKSNVVAFSPDGRRIASAGGWDGAVRVWDAATGREALALTGHTGDVSSVAFSPDGRRIASGGGNGAVRVWDAAAGQEVLSLKRGGYSKSNVAFSPDGRRIASAGGDGAVRVWDARTGQEKLTLKGHTGGVMSVAFSPDGRRIASAGGDGAVRVWDAAGQEMLSLKRGGYSVAFSPDGRRIASVGEGGWTVRVWEAATGREVLSLAGRLSPVHSVAFSPDGRRIASAGIDGAVRVWDAATGREALALKGHTSLVSSVAFSPDGRRIASAGIDGAVRVWDAATLQEMLSLTGHTGDVSSVAFSPDGHRIVSASADGTVKIWDGTPPPPAGWPPGDPPPTEAEGLKICAREGCETSVQDMGPWGRWRWSNGRQLLCLAQQGGYVELEAVCPVAGRYQLAVGFTRADDYGIVQVSLNGQKVGEPFDGFHSAVAPSGKIELGVVELTRGAHRVRFTAVGKNARSKNYYMGIDYVELRPVK